MGRSVCRSLILPCLIGVESVGFCLRASRGILRSQAVHLGTLAGKLFLIGNALALGSRDGFFISPPLVLGFHEDAIAFLGGFLILAALLGVRLGALLGGETLPLGLLGIEAGLFSLGSLFGGTASLFGIGGDLLFGGGG